MSDSLPDDQIVSGILSEEMARAKCQEAAALIIEKHVPGGLWQWLDEKRLRVYTPQGNAFLTLSIEAMQ